LPSPRPWEPCPSPVSRLPGPLPCPWPAPSSRSFLPFLSPSLANAVVPTGASLRSGRRACFLLLLQLALRIEVADAAALAAGSRIDHRVDQGRLAGVHRRVDGALQLVGSRRVDADAAERLHHLVVARALHEYGRRRVGARLVDVGAAIDAVVV